MKEVIQKKQIIKNALLNIVAHQKMYWVEKVNVKKEYKPMMD